MLNLAALEHEFVHFLAALAAVALSQVNVTDFAETGTHIENWFLNELVECKASNKVYFAAANDWEQTHWHVKLLQGFEEASGPATRTKLLELSVSLLILGWVDPPAVLADALLVVEIFILQMLVAVREDLWHLDVTVALTHQGAHTSGQQSNRAKAMINNELLELFGEGSHLADTASEDHKRLRAVSSQPELNWHGHLAHCIASWREHIVDDHR